MLRLALFLVICASALATHNLPKRLRIGTPELDQHWELFKNAYGKRYHVEEERIRRHIWELNVQKIKKHNLEADLQFHTYRLGLNKYADLTNKEYQAALNGYRMGLRVPENVPTFIRDPNVTLPDTVNWVDQGYVTEIKDQGQCGSCWAFSATGSLEGQHFKKTNKLVSLSEQNLIDCSLFDGNLGCFGGLMDNAFDYIKENGGIDTEESYPYTASMGFCQFDSNSIGATLTGYVDVAANDESALRQAVASIGPISVAIDASQDSFQLYKSGIYNEPECSSTTLDHGVLAVGYGTENGQDYWLVKNSWGTSWGLDGYIKMSRNANNQCGIAAQASYPVV